jgi:hypothetical protein
LADEQKLIDTSSPPVSPPFSRRLKVVGTNQPGRSLNRENVLKKGFSTNAYMPGSIS